MSAYWARSHSLYFILIVVAAGYFFAYIWATTGLETTFTWPDERANHFFSTQFSDHSNLLYTEQINEVAHGLVRPRSTSYVNNVVVPTSFLGMPILYGLVAKMFGNGIIMYITPLLAASGGVILFAFLKRIFTKEVALISSLLLFAFPPYWYFAMHGMLHNIPFVIFLLVGMYVFLLQEKNKNRPSIPAVVSGLSVGLALYLRTSEAVWVLPIFIFLSFLFYRTKRPHSLSLFWGSIAIMLLVIGYSNTVVYGSPFAFGYSPESATEGGVGMVSRTLLNKIMSSILPFGVHISQIWEVLWAYILSFFPWFAIPWAVAIGWVLKDGIVRGVRKLFHIQTDQLLQTPAERVYATVYLLVTSWLLVYYGSYIFSEHMLTNTTVLGTSYHRYFLPIFVFGLPLCVKVFQHVGGMVRSHVASRLVVSFLVTMFIALSLIMIVRDPIQGVLQTRRYMISDIALREDVLDLTEDEAVVVTRRYDKVLFPSRKVVAFTSTESEFINTIQDISYSIPVYYIYSSIDPEDEKVKNAIEESTLHTSIVKEWKQSGEVLFRLVHD